VFIDPEQEKSDHSSCDTILAHTHLYLHTYTLTHACTWPSCVYVRCVRGGGRKINGQQEGREVVEGKKKRLDGKDGGEGKR